MKAFRDLMVSTERTGPMRRRRTMRRAIPRRRVRIPFTTGETSLDRELAQISAQSQVDEELAKLKGELAAGGAQKELEEKS